MSSNIFQEGLSNLRTNKEYSTFVSNAKKYRQEEEYQNKLEADRVAKRTALKNHIIRVLNSHFNKQSMGNTTSGDTKLNLHVGGLLEEDITQLKNVLIEKGYECASSDSSNSISVDMCEMADGMGSVSFNTKISLPKKEEAVKEEAVKEDLEEKDLEEKD